MRCARACQVAVLTGDAGHGKSALLREVIRVVREDGGAARRTRVLVAQSSAMLSKCTPLHTARQWLLRWHGANMLPADITARVLKDAGLAADAESAVGRAVGALLGDSNAASVALEEQVAALVAVLTGLAAERPLLLCVEDAEHLDPASLSVLHSLVCAEGAARLCMLVAVRSSQGVVDETMLQWLERDCGQHLEIGPLSTDAARELITITASGGTMPPPVVAFIVEHCGGVPLHVDQMTTAFVESNLLFLGDDGAYELEGSLESLKLPTNLR